MMGNKLCKCGKYYCFPGTSRCSACTKAFVNNRVQWMKEAKALYGEINQDNLQKIQKYIKDREHGRGVKDERD